MAGSKKMLKLLCFFAIIGICVAAKLNVPKLLLPYFSSVATNFTLEVSEGCFTWRSTRPEIVTVNTLDSRDASKCSQLATVTASSRVPARKTAIIIAEDTVSGQQLRCDVIVDEIHSIAIETTTHELYLDDSPEEFVIRAMNEEGDVFSSLDGVPFEWNLLPDSVEGQNLAPANNILRFISFAESFYEALPYIESLERRGKRGDRILVRGVRTGSAKVSVKLDDTAYKPGETGERGDHILVRGVGSGSAKVSVKLDDTAYKHVNDCLVRIIVMANIQLSPPVVYLMQHTTVTYTVELIKQSKTHVIDMPSPQYYLEVRDRLIASMNDKTSTATALMMGDTEVLLKDRNINLPEMFRDPSAGIYVVNPGYLEFQVFPDPNWVLQTNKIYQVTIDVYDKESHKIYPSDNIRIEAYFPKEYFDVQSSSDNGTFHIVRTLQRGITEIDGKLRAVLLQDGTRHEFSPVIQNSQEAEIYDPIKVTPPKVILPWVPGIAEKRENYVFPLTATGGSGNYTWSSSVTSVATVTTKGQVVTATVTGETVVKAADSKNSAHFDTMQTIVLPPSDMEFLPSRVEAEIGTFLELPLAVYGEFKGHRHRFDDCHLMPLNTVVNDKNIFIHIQETKPTAKGSCAGIKVKAMALGHTEVKVTYEYKDIKLKATVTIAAYKPLKPVDPEEITIVTPAASRDMVFEGGPQLWVLDQSGYFQLLGAEKLELVRIHPVKKLDGQRSRHIFRVLCKQLGEQILSLQVGNKATAKNQYPAESKATVRFACEEPRGIRLIPLVTHPAGLPPCPVNPLYDDPVPVHSYKDLNIQVTVKDHLGRKFDNFSSLSIDWELGDQSIASFEQLPGKQQFVTKVITGEKAGIISYKTLVMNDVVGMLDVKATITGYQSHYFTGGVVFESKVKEVISDSRTLDLVGDALIEPDEVTLYNYASNKALLQILHGSGHFHLDVGSTGNAKVQFDDKKSRDISLLPVSEGQFTITAYDLCVEGRSAAKGRVFVSDVHRIELNVVDKVEIYKEITAEVQVYDLHDMLIPAKYFSHMQLKAKPGTDIIAVRSSLAKTNEETTTAHYIVRGAALGRTMLQFIANQKAGMLVSSQPREIQVFPPLRLEPRNITLIIGANLQVTAYGGPQPQSTIKFFMKNGEIASISSTGLVEALELGSSNIVGKAVGMDGSREIIYSQDEVTVNVVMLEGIEIFTPLKRLQTGTRMPLYAMGVSENETPFTFGSANPPLNFRWSINNKEVASLHPLFYESGIIPGPENNFALRLFALEAGHVTVRLSVRPSKGSHNQIRNNRELTDHVQIQVFERLRLTNPAVCDGKMLITPDTEAKVTTNRDGSTSRLSYTIQSQSKDSAVSVDKTGHLISGSTNGQASLVITSHEEFGVNQSLVILVQVKPVSYVMINADTVIHTQGSELSAVPIGTSLQFAVSFHDAVGEKFFATNSKIRYTSNRIDVIQISHGNQNDTLQAKATNIGHTVLKVWDKANPRLVDYVNIGVSRAIYPNMARYTLGDVVCFDSPLLTKQGHKGNWWSDKEAVHVNDESGIALASHAGTTTVFYKVSETLSTYTEVHVEPISGLKLEADSVHYLSNVVNKYKAETSVDIHISGADGQVKSTSVQGSKCAEILQDSNYTVHQLLVRCEVSLSTPHSPVPVEDIVKVAAELDVKTGKYQCKLTPVKATDHLLSTLNTDINLRAVIFPRDNQPKVASPAVTIQYIPAFHAQPEELRLSNEVPVVKLRVSGSQKVLHDLKVHVVDTSLISVSGPEIDRGDSAAHYPISLQLSSGLWDRHQLETLIELSSSLTGQIQTIPVRVKLIGSKEDQPKNILTSWSDFITAVANNYQSIILTLIYIILTVACIVIAYHVILGQRYQAASQQSGVFMPPGSPQQQHNVSGTMSPWSPSQQINRSSTTPTRLWTVDYGPYEGNSLFSKRSPHHSPTYSS